MSLVLCLMDDAVSRQLVSEALIASGFDVTAASTQGPLLDLMSQQPVALALIDTDDQPEETRRLCRLIHNEYDIPILLMTDQNCQQGLLEHLKAGASDCIVKPMRVSELTARAHAAIKRKTGELPSQPPRLRLSCGDLTLDTHNRKVTLRGAPLPISRTGFRLLSYFMQHQDEVITRPALMHNVWGFPINSGDPNIVDTAIRRLRDELGETSKTPCYLHTVWGYGYRFGIQEGMHQQLTES